MKQSFSLVIGQRDSQTTLICSNPARRAGVHVLRAAHRAAAFPGSVHAAGSEGARGNGGVLALEHGRHGGFLPRSASNSFAVAAEPQFPLRSAATGRSAWRRWRYLTKEQDEKTIAVTAASSRRPSTAKEPNRPGGPCRGVAHRRPACRLKTRSKRSSSSPSALMSGAPKCALANWGDFSNSSTSDEHSANGREWDFVPLLECVTRSIWAAPSLHPRRSVRAAAPGFSACRNAARALASAHAAEDSHARTRADSCARTRSRRSSAAMPVRTSHAPTTASAHSRRGAESAGVVQRRQNRYARLQGRAKNSSHRGAATVRSRSRSRIPIRRERDRRFNRAALEDTEFGFKPVAVLSNRTTRESK